MTEERSYEIARFGRKPLVVSYIGTPPCLYCEAPVTEPSMDGPLVCGWCDMGCNCDGSRWTEAQAKERHARRLAELGRIAALPDNAESPSRR